MNSVNIIGVYECKIDRQRRFIIPKHFLRGRLSVELGVIFFISTSRNEIISFFEEDILHNNEILTIKDRFNNIIHRDSDYFYSKIDKARRASIPPELYINILKLTRSIRISGHGDCFWIRAI